MDLKKRGATIHDIAKHVGVSAATVSRVLSGADYPVADDKVRAIIHAAAQLGYHSRASNAAAQKTVHVFVPDLSNPFYTELISGIESTLRLCGLEMILVNTDGALVKEKDIVRELSQRPGIHAIISPTSGDLDHINAWAERNPNIVLLEQLLAVRCSIISFNYLGGGEAATQYLLDRGCRRIGFISPPLTKPSRSLLYEGYLRALVKNGIGKEEGIIKIAASEDRIGGNIYEFDSGIQMMRELIEGEAQLPDAVFCGNDMTAIGVMRYLQQLGHRIPQDISVIGFDNIQIAAVTTPSLTTIDQCVYEMGSMAAEALNGRLVDPKRKPVNVVLEPKIIVRESVR